MTSGPNALVVTSDGAPSSTVTVMIAALEVAGVSVRAVDVGRVGSRAPGAVDRVLRVLVSELAERRLVHELGDRPPDVAVAFDPGSVRVLAEARDESSRPFPVAAVVSELDPDDDWGHTDADRYFAVDDDAAVTLADAGVPGDRICQSAPSLAMHLPAAGKRDRGEVRRQFKLSNAEQVVLVEVDGMGFEASSQLALQLSLASQGRLFLFDAGRDTDAATALRQTVPTLDLRAKLFGAVADSPLFWRCADAIVAKASRQAIARSLAVGAHWSPSSRPRPWSRKSKRWNGAVAAKSLRARFW